MKNLNANDLDQVAGGMTEDGNENMVGGPVTFFCETCNNTFTTNAGTREHGYCPVCGSKGIETDYVARPN